MTGPAKNRLHDYEAGWLTCSSAWAWPLGRKPTTRCAGSPRLPSTREKPVARGGRQHESENATRNESRKEKRGRSSFFTPLVRSRTRQDSSDEAAFSLQPFVDEGLRHILPRVCGEPRTC